MNPKTLIPLLLLLLAACTPMTMDDMEEHMMVTSEEGFITDMIPHHQEAISTSVLVYGSTEDEDLKNLTVRIVDAQRREVEMMQGWLDAWYEGGSPSMYMAMMPDLDRFEGEDRDRAYLEGMIEHHEMAVVMAEQVLELDPRPEVAAFAQDVIDVQSSEIAEMQTLLE